MRAVVRTIFHAPEYYCTKGAQVGEKTFDSIKEAVKEFNRVVEVTENLMRIKDRFEYQPYDSIELIVNGITKMIWRKEDAL